MEQSGKALSQGPPGLFFSAKIPAHRAFQGLRLLPELLLHLFEGDGIMLFLHDRF